MSDNIISLQDAVGRMLNGQPCETNWRGEWRSTEWPDFGTFTKFRIPPEPRRVAREFWLLFDRQGFVAIFESEPTALAVGEKVIHVREVLPDEVCVRRMTWAEIEALHKEHCGWHGFLTALGLIGEGS